MLVSTVVCKVGNCEEGSRACLSCQDAVLPDILRLVKGVLMRDIDLLETIQGQLITSKAKTTDKQFCLFNYSVTLGPGGLIPRGGYCWCEGGGGTASLRVATHS